jgi:polysaccharide deacetylase 2 family uncharacterized protein YibQ
MRSLIITWIVTLLLLGTGIIWAKMTYVPPPFSQPITDYSLDLGGNAAEEESEANSTATEIAEFVAPDGSILDQRPKKTDSQETSENLSPGIGFTVDNTITPEPSVFQNSYTISSADPELTEDGPYGKLPITKNQRQPWKIYSRHFEKSGDRPLISLIISNVGLNTRMTQTAIDELPPEVTFALSPYAQDLDRLSDSIRKAGHETLLMLPMEPIDFPLNDPGPHTLMTNLSDDKNLDRLYWVLAQTNGYVGVVNEMGSKFTGDVGSIRHIMKNIQKRGIAFIDSRTTQFSLGAKYAQEFGIPKTINNRFIDNELSAAQIDRYLRELENIARGSGFAVGIGRTKLLTYKRIVEWAQTLEEKGIDLAPITAIINYQEPQ